MTRFIKDLQDAIRFLDGYYIEAGELSGDDLQNLDDHIMDQVSGPRGYDELVVTILTTLLNQNKDLQIAIKHTVDNLYELEFCESAKYIIQNPDLFERDGDDEYGDIVFWAERQLEVADEVFDICEESGEIPAEWFEEEVAVLRNLIEKYYRGEIL